MGALSNQLTIFRSATYWSSTTKLGKGFGIVYPDDATKVQAYIDQLDAGNYAAAPPHDLTTKHAQGLVGMLAVLAAAAAAQPPLPKPLHVTITGVPAEGHTLQAAIS